MITAQESIDYKGRTIKMHWYESFDFPKGIPVSQASILCLDQAHEVLLIKNQNGRYNLPGGHPEAGEKPGEVVIRELNEEAYTVAKNINLLGYIEVFDPANTGREGTHYLQLRYAGQLEKLEPFKGEFETVSREFASFEELQNFLPWIKNSIGKVTLKSLEKYRNRFRLKTKNRRLCK